MSNLYNACIEGTNVRIVKADSGTSVNKITVGKGATHAIMEGERVNVFYRKGGVKMYSKGGSLISFSGICE